MSFDWKLLTELASLHTLIIFRTIRLEPLYETVGETSVNFSNNNEPTRFGVVKSSIPSMSKGGRNTQRARNVGCAGTAREQMLAFSPESEFKSILKFFVFIPRYLWCLLSRILFFQFIHKTWENVWLIFNYRQLSNLQLFFFVHCSTVIISFVILIFYK